MLVNGIQWHHPAYSTRYYGFNPSVWEAESNGIALIAWLTTTPAYDTFWTVKGTVGNSELFRMNFVGEETALVGAAILTERFSDEVA
jgi:hypothetical protein